MLFSSLIFLIVFLPLVFIVYYALPKSLKNVFLLLASLFFYAWGNTNHLFILVISILLNYSVGVGIQKLRDGAGRKALLAAGVLANLFILFYYKYFNFLIDNFNQFLGLGLPNEPIALPIGISFFTFQGLSYIIDVYQKKVEGNSNFIEIGLYIAMFPQLVAGPIIKYIDIKDQLKKRQFDAQSVAIGIQRFIIGLSKKVLLADVLGEAADKIFTAASGSGIDTPTAWLGIVCYTLQIYFDFSGYSDMAIGLGRMFGFTYKENFNYPYISKSITEFWRRWHISLSTWFREYLYIPLGGNRKGNVYFNLFVVFCATGIWHGASWNFVIWGLWHGFFIITERFLMKKGIYENISPLIRWPLTLFIVMMGWVLFRAEGLHAAVDYFGYLFGALSPGTLQFSFLYYFDARLALAIFIGCILSAPFIKNGTEKFRKGTAFAILKIPALLVLLVLSLTFIVNSNYSPFIYFQF